MNLETKLNESLHDVLKSAGYIFEIINNNKKQSNTITGSNNQLITPIITAQLSNSLSQFDDLLDETVSKFNDAKWCVEQILENKQKQEELKLKEGIERQKRKEEEEKRKKEEEEQRRKEEEDRKHKEEEEKKRKEQEEEQRVKEAERLKNEKQEQEKKQQMEAKQAELRKQQEEEAAKLQSNSNDINDFISPGFDFNMGDLTGDKSGGLDIPNPADILSSINYEGFGGDTKSNNESTNSTAKTQNSNNNNANDNNDDKNFNTNGLDNDLDLDMNNLLGNDELLLDGLNMSLLDQGYGGDNAADNGVNMEEEFDVDNFLNQFGGGD